ncbi:MAG: SPFH/Band 7/PHB domain protein [Chloroflexi bacterium]|jgi:regulator of protease activity HflC (stomatin/prohibitin superfamily)|nr:SPFH/Band 7/PHB domain protein [Chloroflexota bacterium]MBT7080881.1 SPFH/Band 7/PHB domain protein [Chloroflexota bacterium]MBT7290779.1 SPFH/Band 7/PHB domain protein [Chloroflexota bacterium]
MIAGIIVGIIVVIMLVVALAKSITVVHQAEKVIIERLGRYKETLDPGLKFIVPFIDNISARIDMRETVLDIAPQPVITKDNVSVTVDAVVYYYVTEARAVRYEVANFNVAVSKLAQTSLRNLIGDMQLDQSLTSREVINTSLREILDEATDKWGVKVTRVEVKEIEPPHDIADAMSKQMKAEREKRSVILSAEAYRDKQILEAEGDKQNAILVAEGNKQQNILIAEGQRQSAILVAEGEAQAIQNVSLAAEKFFIGNAQTLKQLEVTQASLEKNSKIIVPDKSRLINVISMLKGEEVIENLTGE